VEPRSPNEAALLATVRDWRVAKTSLTSAAAALTEVLGLSAREIGLHPEEVKILAVAHLFGPRSARKLATALGTADEQAVQANLREMARGGLVQCSRREGAPEEWSATVSGSHKLWEFQREGVVATVTDHYILVLDRPLRQRATGSPKGPTTSVSRKLEPSSVR